MLTVLAHPAGKLAGVRGLSLATPDAYSGSGSLANQDQEASAVGSQEGEAKSPISPTGGLWKDAAERVTLHALVLKHLVGGDTQEADRSCSDSEAERTSSGRYASTSAPQRGDALPSSLLALQH